MKQIRKSKQSLSARIGAGKTDASIEKFLQEAETKCSDLGGWENYKKKFLPLYQSRDLTEKFGDIKTLSEAKKLYEKQCGFSPATRRLKKLHEEWARFLERAIEGSDKKTKSLLNDGTEEISFLFAMMRETNLLGATCIHVASGKYEKMNFSFDRVIMDESSKASPAETLVPIQMAKSITLIGDHCQLPPVVTREKKVHAKIKVGMEDVGLEMGKDFGEKSLFEQLISAFEGDPDRAQYVKMLDTQYRMPQKIGDLISKFFYAGKLKSGEHCGKPHGFMLKTTSPIIFVSTSQEKNPSDNNDKLNRKNECNVRIIQEILDELDRRMSREQKNENLTVAVIAGYRGQVNYLEPVPSPATRS